MSTKGGTYKGHLFHGDPIRFEVLAAFIFETFGRKINTIADVAGGKGMLTRILAKKYNYDSIVVDPRGFPLLGVPNLAQEYQAVDVSQYDLVVGLHPDEATRQVAQSALATNTILIPCCNFWDQTQKLGRDAMLHEISQFYLANNVHYKQVTFNFEGPKNIGLVTFKTQLHLV